MDIEKALRLTKSRLENLYCALPFEGKVSDLVSELAALYPDLPEMTNYDPHRHFRNIEGTAFNEVVIAGGVLQFTKQDEPSLVVGLVTAFDTENISITLAHYPTGKTQRDYYYPESNQQLRWTILNKSDYL